LCCYPETVRLAIDRLLSDGLRLELPHEGSPPNRLELERGLGVRGVYAHDAETIMLEGLVADELDATTVVWRFGESSRIEAAPLVLGGAEIDLRIARGPLRGRHRLAGSIGARDVQGKAIAVTVGTTAIVGVGLEGSSVSFRTGHGEPTEVKLGRLALAGVAIAAGNVRVEIESLECRGGALRLGASISRARPRSCASSGRRRAKAAASSAVRSRFPICRWTKRASM